MAIDMRPILVGDTNKISLDLEFSLTEGEIPFDTQIDGVVFTKPAHVSGEIVNMGGYIGLTATVSVCYSAECA